MTDLRIAYNHEESTELVPRYFVFDSKRIVLYKGSYVQCLVLVGAFSLYRGYEGEEMPTIQSINDKTGGFLNG